MKKIQKEDYFELAVFLMDYHSGQFSRGYRLLSRLGPANFTASLSDYMRESDIYQYLVANYSESV